MTRKELVKHDVDLGFAFTSYLIEHPSEIERLPDKFETVFIENGSTVLERESVTEPGTVKLYVQVQNNTFIF